MSHPPLVVLVDDDDDAAEADVEVEVSAAEPPEDPRGLGDCWGARQLDGAEAVRRGRHPHAGEAGDGDEAIAAGLPELDAARRCLAVAMGGVETADRERRSGVARRRPRGR